MEYREAAQMINRGVCVNEVTVTPTLLSLSLSATSSKLQRYTQALV